MVRKVLFGVLGIILLLVIYYQIKAELYIYNREKTCCILNGKTRISYKPIAFYYAEIVLVNVDFGKDETLSSLLSNSSTCPETCVSSVGGWEQYLVNSYYTNQEKIDLIRKYVPNSPILN